VNTGAISLFKPIPTKRYRSTLPIIIPCSFQGKVLPQGLSRMAKDKEARLQLLSQ
jgi:hypothetical protein